MRPVSMIRPGVREGGASYVSKTDMVAALMTVCEHAHSPCCCP